MIEGNKKILIIDDQEEIGNVVKLTLESEGPYTVRVATSGMEGLSMVREEMPDLIILDIMMPGMSGTDVASRLSEDSRFCQIPILFATGLVAESEIDALSKTVGGRDFLAKPFDTDQLHEKIEKLLRG